ncbi:Eco57I restriction-modification methylase domain-containing protein [Ichthyenterobacterium magnum]|uniref:site-specific DNA-methyltransferase (adenine-specific) n=1 Tax=Ichthyenterobacterium magnum TaxID=1230530 RepID=A0A420DGQ9_9FLAO|nr:N-6 DNA methylase [Ichthyenterobacterium magnum]RKE92267.1 N-6 DNA methylase [Ichthyenterobacterium magnum]
MSIDKKILSFLETSSFKVEKINSFIVTTFCNENSLVVNNNRLLLEMLIGEEDSDYLALNNFAKLFRENNQTFDFECLIELFEFVISPSDKIVNGAVYTPKYIRDFIVSNSIILADDIDLKTVCDVACGCGGFLFEYALKVHELTNKGFAQIIEENLYGIDITEYSIERTRILLSLLALYNGEDPEYINFNLFKGDSLEFDWFENSQVIRNNEGFDFVFSNPPYVGSSNLDENTKSLMKNWSVTSTGKLDLYIPFFEIGLKWLKEEGVLGYITVNNFYRSLNGRALRSYFSSNSFKFKLIDFGSEQVFKSRLTYTCICQITKSTGNLSYTSSTPHKIDKLTNSDFIDFEYSSLNDFDGWQLDDAQTQLALKRLENSGKKLGDLFNIRNGFATLRNKIYLFKPIDEDEHFYYLEKDSKRFKVERAICRNAIKPNILKDETDLEVFNEKLIFPYQVIEQTNDDLFEQQSNRLIRVLDPGIFERNFPNAYNYLNTCREELSKRDKGQRDYETWFAYGRSQALNIPGLKLLFPYISDKPYFVFTNNEDLLFYNGYAIVSDSEDDLKFIQKILKTEVFWYYIKHTSKPYSSNYYALAKNYIKNFSIPEFTTSEKTYFMNLKRKSAINKFLLNKYNITDNKL